MQNITVKHVIHRGKLLLATPSDHHKLEAFYKSLPEGTVIDTYYSAESDTSDEKSFAQLAKVHVLIKQLSGDAGYTPGEMKELVKKEAGLYDTDGSLKSFKDCTKNELMTAIQACITIGGNIGSNVY